MPTKILIFVDTYLDNINPNIDKNECLFYCCKQ